MKKLIPMTLFALLLALAGAGLAQDDTTGTDTTGTDTTQTQAQPTVAAPQSNIEFLFVACDNQAVVNVTGFIVTGFDVYYQVYNGAGLSGGTLTGLRQVQVDGNFAFSEVIPYVEGGAIGAGGTGSIRVAVAREGNPDSVDFDATADDVNDGCNNPQNPQGTSVDLGGGGVSPEPQAPAQVQILTPGGGILNPNRQTEDLVEVGARQSDRFRSDTPGLIFAECDDYPQAVPGIVYDTDDITVFWSWFAKDEETLAQHLQHSNYSVKINTAGMPNAVGSAPQEINGDLWVFYTVPVGNLRPGHYEIEFRLTWDQPVSDGYDDFGPGTSNEMMASNCNFDVIRNAAGSPVYTDMYWPSAYPVHNLNPGYEGGESGLGDADQVNLDVGQPVNGFDNNSSDD